MRIVSRLASRENDQAFIVEAIWTSTPDFFRCFFARMYRESTHWIAYVNTVFIGQLQSTTGGKIEVWVRGLQLDFGFVDTSSYERKKANNGISIPLDELDNLQGLILNARMRAGAMR